jgi:Holliday junction DNA helicase RuvA subunit
MICGLNYDAIVVKDHVAEVTLRDGVVYEVRTPMVDEEWESAGGQRRQMYVYHQITERGQALYGFETRPIRQLFTDLITVDSLGCAKAIKILSSMEPDKVGIHIAEGDVASLVAAKGIGAVSAERIITELRPKYEKLYAVNKDLGKVNPFSTNRPEHAESIKIKLQETTETATLGLIKLGYSKRAITQMLKTVDYSTLIQKEPFTDTYDFNHILGTLMKISIDKLNSGAHNV